MCQSIFFHVQAIQHTAYNPLNLCCRKVALGEALCFNMSTRWPGKRVNIPLTRACIFFAERFVCLSTLWSVAPGRRCSEEPNIEFPPGATYPVCNTPSSSNSSFNRSTIFERFVARLNLQRSQISCFPILRHSHSPAGKLRKLRPCCRFRRRESASFPAGGASSISSNIATTPPPSAMEVIASYASSCSSRSRLWFQEMLHLIFQHQYIVSDLARCTGLFTSGMSERSVGARSTQTTARLADSHVLFERTDLPLPKQKNPHAQPTRSCSCWCQLVTIDHSPIADGPLYGFGFSGTSLSFPSTADSTPRFALLWFANLFFMYSRATLRLIVLCLC